MKQVGRDEFWQHVKSLERWHKNKIRFSQNEILEEGPGYQLQGKTWRDAVTGEVLAQYVARVEDALHINSEYKILA